MSKPDNNTAQLRQALEQLASETESVGHSHCEQEYCDGWFGEDPYRDTIDQLLALFQEHSTARVPQKRDLGERISTDEKSETPPFLWCKWRRFILQ